MADIKVGDTVAWADVPDGAMVRDADGDHAVSFRASGAWVQVNTSRWFPWWACWPWGHGDGTPGMENVRVTIIALGLTGSETAANLQRMAEVFDIRQALTADILGSGELCKVLAGLPPGHGWFYERLHAAGWRAGMTAEDAARLLARVATNTDQEAFARHLEASSAAVQAWPKWKQDVLGGVRSPTEDRSKPPLTAREQCDNLVAGLADSVLDMTDAEVEAEVREQGLDPAVEATRVRDILVRAVHRAAKLSGEPPPGYAVHTIHCSVRPTVYGWTQGRLSPGVTPRQVVASIPASQRMASKADALAAAWAHHDAHAKGQS